MLERFAGAGVRATWATVGFLFADGRRELEAHIPSKLPLYRNSALSPYEALSSLGQSEKEDPYHFAPSLIAQIAQTPGQEIASHTFSHFYCLEACQDRDAFCEDLAAARAIGARYGDVTRALVFPRGQVNAHYLGALKQHGVVTYRTSPPFFAYRPTTTARENVVRRAARLADAYLPLSSNGAFSTSETNAPVPLTASMFLRPYNARLAAAEPLKRRRITRAMKSAARRGQDFHLWWHPHNFGADVRHNFATLDAILATYRELRDEVGWQSATMSEAATVESAA